MNAGVLILSPFKCNLEVVIFHAEDFGNDNVWCLEALVMIELLQSWNQDISEILTLYTSQILGFGLN